MPERRIEIGFGTLFRAAENSDRVDVIINVGRGNWCSAAELIETSDSEKCFFIPGTATKDDLGEIIGRMSYEEMMKAAELGAKRAGLQRLPDSMRAIGKI